MKNTTRHFLFTLLIILFSEILSSQSNPDDKYWSSYFGLPANDEVRALYSDDNNLFHSEFGSIKHYNLLDNTYENLGVTGSGGFYDALKIVDTLYFAGTFEEIGDSPAKFIAKYFNGKWDSVGQRLNGIIYTICTDGKGNIYAGGKFTKAGLIDGSNVAMWNGTEWKAIGLPLNGAVKDLVYHNGKLYAGGDFTYSGDSILNKIALYNFDTNTWSALGNGLGENTYEYVASLEFNDKDELFAGGYFSGLDSVKYSNIAKWDGKKWNKVGNGLDNTIFTLHYANNKLYAGGLFNKSGSTVLNKISFFDGNEWQPMLTGLSGPEYPTAMVITHTPKGEIIIGGNFTNAGNTKCWGTVYWDGQKFITKSPELRNGALSHIYSFLVEPKTNILYAGGAFVKTGEVVSYGISKFDGSKWIGCNNGLTPMADVVYSMAQKDGDIYFSGWFYNGDGIQLNNVAKWIDSKKTWESIGSGIDGDDGFLGKIHISGNNLYVTGKFTSIGSDSMYYVTRWDGTKWNSMDGGFNRNGSIVRASNIAEDIDGKIYFVGNIQTAGSLTVNGIAIWNPQLEKWETLSNHPAGTYYSILIDNDKIYFGGNFAESKSSPASLIAVYDKTNKSWTMMANNATGAISVMTKWENSIYVAGDFNFESNGKTISNSIARYNPETGFFENLGSGIKYKGYGGISTLAVYNNELYVGGMFDVAGGKMSSNIAKWSKNPLTVTDGANNQSKLISYPNPAKNEFNIEIPELIQNGFKLEITNINGRVLIERTYQSTNGKLIVNIENLSSGLYFYNLIAADRTYNGSFNVLK